jgi:hypothetical protein
MSNGGANARCKCAQRASACMLERGKAKQELGGSKTRRQEDCCIKQQECALAEVESWIRHGCPANVLQIQKMARHATEGKSLFFS